MSGVTRRASLLAPFLLSACAPTVQRPLMPPADFGGPRFEKDAFVSFDGARLGLSTWEADEEPWAVVIGLHGMNDYARTFEGAGPYWAQHGVTTYAYDARGFGRSQGRGFWPGEALMVQDLRTIVVTARARHPRAIVAVAGESMGAAQAMVASAQQELADRVVLVSPAVWGWAAQPVIYTLPLWLAAHTLPGKQVSPPRGLKITPSDNEAMLIAIGRDKNMLFRTRFDAIYGLVVLMDDAAAAAAKQRANTLFLYGAHDQIIPKDAALTTARRLPEAVRTVLYPQAYHMMLRDLQAQIVWDDILAFLKDPDSPLPSGAGPIIPVSRTLTSSR
jgi:alpha-beta hydrolase superfamily lysophospholipase